MVLRYIVNAAIVMLIIMMADAGPERALDPPHNEDYAINCFSYHVIHEYSGKPGPSLTKSTHRMIKRLKMRRATLLSTCPPGLTSSQCL